MSGTLAPAPWWTMLNDDGSVAGGALLYFYLSGSSTPATVYHDAALTMPWSTPVVCDGSGRATIYLDVYAYKLMATTALGVPLGPTVDPVGSVGLNNAGTYSIFEIGGDDSVAITATAYPVGATADKVQSGAAEFVMDSGLLPGSYKLSGMIKSTAGATITAALVNLTDGSTESPLATITGTSTTGSSVLSGLIPWAAPGVAKTYGVKVANNLGGVAAGNGFVYGLQIVQVPTIIGSTGPVQLFNVFNFFGDPTSPITATTYVTGALYSACHAGSAWYTVDSATLAAGTYNLSGMLLGVGGTTVTVSLFNLTDAPNTAIVSLSGSSPTGASALSPAITFASPGTPKTYGLKAILSGGGPAYAWAIQLVKTA